jgi:hypothetical protein
MQTISGEYLVQGEGPAEPSEPSEPSEPEEPEEGFIPEENPIFLCAAAGIGLILLWTVYNYIRGITS